MGDPLPPTNIGLELKLVLGMLPDHLQGCQSDAMALHVSVPRNIRECQGNSLAPATLLTGSVFKLDKGQINSSLLTRTL